ncbi:hypothetical protein TNCV_15341 [Trichonephila clavipes]|nr:hypothetical protein TNCV_15341 [Trichonephila clavipes]
MTHAHSAEEERVAVEKRARGNFSTNHDDISRRVLTTWSPIDKGQMGLVCPSSLNAYRPCMDMVHLNEVEKSPVKKKYLQNSAEMKRPVQQFLASQQSLSNFQYLRPNILS